VGERERRGGHGCLVSQACGWLMKRMRQQGDREHTGSGVHASSSSSSTHSLPQPLMAVTGLYRNSQQSYE